MPAVQETIDRVRKIDVDQYKYGFQTEIAVDKAPKGLSEDIIRFISAKKDEPSWMLEWRLEAYRRWLTLEEPTWARVHYPKIDFQDIYYYAAPKSTPGRSSPACRRRMRPISRSPATTSTNRAVSPSTRCSIPSPSSPPSRRNWRRP